MVREGWTIGVLALVLAACGQPSDGPSLRDNTLVVTNSTDIDSINNLISQGSAIARDVERLLFLQLLKERPSFESGIDSFDPQLAESWEASEDGLALTFRLREVAWSDGTPITAEDVRWSWSAQTDPDVAWRLSGQKESILDVEVVDARTVRFHFSEVYPGQLNDANDGTILPRHVWGSLPFSEWRSKSRWFVDNIVTSGPFVLESWEPNQDIVLRRNERYYEPGLPRLERLVVSIVPKSSQVNQLLSGSVDYVQVLPPGQIERVEARADIEIDAYWGRALDYLCWNTNRPPLDDARVRLALTRAIDRPTIIESIYRGYARPAISTVLSTTWAFHPELEPWSHDLEEARRLLAAAGLGDADGDGTLERDGRPLSIELLVQNNNEVHLDAAVLIQAQLARAGIDLELRPVEFQTWVDLLGANDFDAAIGGWEVPTSLDPRFAFHTEEADNYNWGRYSNPELDALLDGLAGLREFEERKLLLHEVQEILHRDQPYTFLWEPQKLDAHTGRLRGNRPNALSPFYNIAEWWLEPR